MLLELKKKIYIYIYGERTTDPLNLLLEGEY